MNCVFCGGACSYAGGDELGGNDIGLWFCDVCGEVQPEEDDDDE